LKCYFPENYSLVSGAKEARSKVKNPGKAFWAKKQPGFWSKVGKIFPENGLAGNAGINNFRDYHNFIPAILFEKISLTYGNP